MRYPFIISITVTKRRPPAYKRRPLTDSLWGSSVEVGTIQRRLAWPLRKDDTHTQRIVNNCYARCKRKPFGRVFARAKQVVAIFVAGMRPAALWQVTYERQESLHHTADVHFNIPKLQFGFIWRPNMLPYYQAIINQTMIIAPYHIKLYN